MFHDGFAAFPLCLVLLFFFLEKETNKKFCIFVTGDTIRVLKYSGFRTPVERVNAPHIPFRCWTTGQAKTVFLCRGFPGAGVDAR